MDFTYALSNRKFVYGAWEFFIMSKASFLNKCYNLEYRFTWYCTYDPNHGCPSGQLFENQ